MHELSYIINKYYQLLLDKNKSVSSRSGLEIKIEYIFLRINVMALPKIIFGLYKPMFNK